jgi:protein PhnA
MLNGLQQESRVADSLDMMYLDDTQLAWAKATGDHENDSSVDLHKDCNWQVLQAGDSVILIKSLDVKGSSLNTNVEGQTIIILTKFVRKQH